MRRLGLAKVDFDAFHFVHEGRDVRSDHFVETQRRGLPAFHPLGGGRELLLYLSLQRLLLDEEVLDAECHLGSVHPRALGGLFGLH